MNEEAVKGGEAGVYVCVCVWEVSSFLSAQWEYKAIYCVFHTLSLQ